MGVPPFPLPIGIIELRAKTTKIFGFKGVIWKIFRNKELTLSKHREPLLRQRPGRLERRDTGKTAHQ